MKIAVVGAGVSGIVTSWILGREHEVDLYEADSRIGGHTNTVTLSDGEDAGAEIDTGFIVLNDKNYPLFHRFLKQLGIGFRWSDMSFGYQCQQSGMEYAGRNIFSLFCKKSNLLSPTFYKFLWEIKRFCEVSTLALDKGELSGLSLGQFLSKKKFSEAFGRHYLLPMSAAIWSSPDEDILDFPAERFVQFFKNHGLLGLSDRPRWQTVEGGSHSYLKAFEEKFKGTIHRSTPVKAVVQSENKPSLLIDKEVQEYDKVVLACHADQSARILENKESKLSKVVSKWSYHRNRVYLHSDPSVMPSSRRTWCSWNYLRTSEGSDRSKPVFVSYYMNHLQGLKLKKDYFVTLNPPQEIEPDLVEAEIVYEHPCFEMSVSGTSSLLAESNGEEGVYLAGAYTGNGFHEDGVRSAVEVCRKMGMEL